MGERSSSQKGGRSSKSQKGGRSSNPRRAGALQVLERRALFRSCLDGRALFVLEGRALFKCPKGERSSDPKRASALQIPEGRELFEIPEVRALVRGYQPGVGAMPAITQDIVSKGLCIVYILAPSPRPGPWLGVG